MEEWGYWNNVRAKEVDNIRKHIESINLSLLTGDEVLLKIIGTLTEVNTDSCDKFNEIDKVKDVLVAWVDKINYWRYEVNTGKRN